MEKKIGVLTFHKVINYGAALQAYALASRIKLEGYNCEIIDYRNKILEDKNTLRKFSKIKSISRILYDIFELPFWVIRKKRFEKFMGLVPHSHRTNSIDDKFSESYYKLFVGSDQVWNYKITGFDKNYLFCNLSDNKKKNSYAASFGVENIPSELVEEYRVNLSKFNNIAVREKTGVDLINKICEEEVIEVVDPTLLLTKEQWQSLTSKRLIKEDYILIYQLAYSENLIRFAKQLAAETRMKIVTINGNPRQPINAQYILTAGPIEWLNLMENAKYVVTNSFHGVAFSINLNKEFFVDLLDEKFGVNSRINNILSSFKLENRKIKSNRSLTQFEKIDFKDVNRKLDELRNLSVNYLRKSLD